MLIIPAAAPEKILPGKNSKKNWMITPLPAGREKSFFMILRIILN
jgi:hypothetical protein